MKKTSIVLAASVLFLGLATPSFAGHERGEIKEIIIKVQTEEGEKFYRIGKDTEQIDIRSGDVVEFDYADDVVVGPVRRLEEGMEEPEPSTGQ